MEPKDHARISGHLWLQDQMVHGVLVAMILIIISYSLHQMKLVATISAIDLIVFGLGKAALMIFHAALSTTLHTSVYSFHQQPLTGLNYVSVVTKKEKMNSYRCCLLSFTCNKI
jgi:hypothetical protein